MAGTRSVSLLIAPRPDRRVRAGRPPPDASGPGRGRAHFRGTRIKWDGEDHGTLMPKAALSPKALGQGTLIFSGGPYEKSRIPDHRGARDGHWVAARPRGRAGLARQVPAPRCVMTDHAEAETARSRRRPTSGPGAAAAATRARGRQQRRPPQHRPVSVAAARPHQVPGQRPMPMSGPAIRWPERRPRRPRRPAVRRYASARPSLGRVLGVRTRSGLEQGRPKPDIEACDPAPSFPVGPRSLRIGRGGPGPSEDA